jgi:hypothetical protein
MPREAANTKAAQQSPTEPPPSVAATPNAEQPSIEKPEQPNASRASRLARFRTRDAETPTIQTLLTALPHFKISDAGDWVRLHPNEETHWSEEYFFINVPVQGQSKDTLHLIDAGLAKLIPGRVQAFRLALASKPGDVFFLAHVPTRNLDNEWNKTSLKACAKAKTQWVMVSSQRAAGKEGYRIDNPDIEPGDPPPFPEPNWPQETLEELVDRTFEGRMIFERTDPAWIRLVAGRQKIS